MQRWLWGSMAALGVLLFTGCSLAPSDKVLGQLMQSERSWCMSVTSVYGTLRVGGSGIPLGTMTCTQEGLTLSAGGTQLQVPLTIQVAPVVTVKPQ